LDLTERFAAKRGDNKCFGTAQTMMLAKIPIDKDMQYLLTQYNVITQMFMICTDVC
jgi:hypothetical protein